MNTEAYKEKVILNITRLMLLFLPISMVANYLNNRIEFSILYLFMFFATLKHYYCFRSDKNIENASEQILVILFGLFFSFFIIGEQRTFDVLWILTFPVVAVMTSSRVKLRIWLLRFLTMILMFLPMAYFFQEYIRYDTFALFSLLWASIFVSYIAYSYKKIQDELEEKISSYQNSLESEIEDTSQAYLESRLRSLETQLNPHFLFNALNSIAELIHHDKDKAEIAVLKVSSFLRNTMNEEALLSLKEEVKYVKEYVELENIRFSNKIHIDIIGNIPNWQVPKFSLQLIVENAIKHSFVRNQDKLNIKIGFDMRKKIIKVENNGKAMDKKSFGVGLSNLQQRLELLCDGSLSVESLERSMFYIHLGESCEDINS